MNSYSVSLKPFRIQNVSSDRNTKATNTISNLPGSLDLSQKELTVLSELGSKVTPETDKHKAIINL
jgi:hypothetical protein